MQRKVNWLPDPKTYPPPQRWDISPEEEEILAASDKTTDWLLSLPGSFFLPYAGTWIAAEDCRIVACGKTYDELLTKLGDADLSAVVIHHVPPFGSTRSVT